MTKTPHSPPKDDTRRIKSRKSRDAAALLPLIGLLLLVTPLVATIPNDSGIPGAFLYIFGVWAGLILLAALLSRRLNRDDRD